MYLQEGKIPSYMEVVTVDFVVGWVFWSNWGSCLLVSWSGKVPHLLQVRSWGGGRVSAAFSLALSRADEALA